MANSLRRNFSSLGKKCTTDSPPLLHRNPWPRTSEQRRTNYHDPRGSSLDATKGKEKLVADIEATRLKKHIETQKHKNCAFEFWKKSGKKSSQLAL